MTRTDDLDTGWEEDRAESLDAPADSTDIPVDLDGGDAGEITTGETEVSLDELGLDSDLEPGDDPCPSPFDRPTIVPPIPEHEYVAQMMRDLPESERLPSSRSLTPSAPLPTLVAPAPTSSRRPTKMPDPISSRPTPIEPMSALTLDLSDSDPPRAAADPEQTGVRERSSFPAARPVAPDLVDDGSKLPMAQALLSFGPSSGDALDLVGVRAQSIKPGASPSVTMREVRDRFDVGDFTGALVLAEGILEQDTENADALLYAEHCRDVLKQMYISRLGGVRRVPQIAMSPEELRWLALDHRAGFLLSLVDGRCTVDEVLDMSGMPDLDALRVLMQLLQQNVIKVL